MKAVFLVSTISSVLVLASCQKDIWGNNHRECHVIRNAGSFWPDTVSSNDRDYGLTGHFYRRLQQKCQAQADTLNKYNTSYFDNYSCSCNDSKVE